MRGVYDKLLPASLVRGVVAFLYDPVNRIAS
jgi:hypothetical protein